MITTVMLESEQSQHYYVVSSIFASTVKIVYLPVIAVCVCVCCILSFCIGLLCTHCRLGWVPNSLPTYCFIYLLLTLLLLLLLLRWVQV